MELAKLTRSVEVLEGLLEVTEELAEGTVVLDVLKVELPDVEMLAEVSVGVLFEPAGLELFCHEKVADNAGSLE